MHPAILASAARIQVGLQAAALVAIFRRESRDAALAWLQRHLPQRLPLLPGHVSPVGLTPQLTLSNGSLLSQTHHSNAVARTVGEMA